MSAAEPRFVTRTTSAGNVMISAENAAHWARFLDVQVTALHGLIEWSGETDPEWIAVWTENLQKIATLADRLGDLAMEAQLKAGVVIDVNPGASILRSEITPPRVKR